MRGPRGRWPRPPRGHPSYRARGSPRGGSSTTSANVPTIHQVVPGAPVFIVLKEDQPTGHEVQGVVQDLLTKGNHPRGIKVRLQDGRVGRVQRMGGGGISTSAAFPTASATTSASSTAASRPNRITRMERDVRLDEPDCLSEPPTRSLADYFPDLGSKDELAQKNTLIDTETVKCPICGNFEGDEWAVSRHVEEHLT